MMVISMLVREVTIFDLFSLEVLVISDPVEMKTKAKKKILLNCILQRLFELIQKGEVSLPWKENHLPIPKFAYELKPFKVSYTRSYPFSKEGFEGALKKVRRRDHDRRIRVRRFAGERCLPGCVIERYSGLTPGVIVRGAISYQGRSNLLRIESIPGAIFQQDNAHPHVAKTVRDFCSAQHMQLLPWPAYSPDMSSIEHVWDLVGRRFARGLRPAASKDELLLRIHAIWKSIPHADIQNLFDSMPRRIAALIAACGGYTE
ncbi:transposable element Tc1 transposase [Trichonephila clavipes]|uniref:Transposable element Tc1 transposase n=1 Tax=Trichonephila clavipes TaxID=2585209 RepID=A0A8X6RHF7_TRICX|nr:transposable element Tc1 transposase [Trichonephila clavipes]